MSAATAWIGEPFTYGLWFVGCHVVSSGARLETAWVVLLTKLFAERQHVDSGMVFPGRPCRSSSRRRLRPAAVPVAGAAPAGLRGQQKLFQIVAGFARLGGPVRLFKL